MDYDTDKCHTMCQISAIYIKKKDDMHRPIEVAAHIVFERYRYIQSNDFYKQTLFHQNFYRFISHSDNIKSFFERENGGIVNALAVNQHPRRIVCL